MEYDGAECLHFMNLHPPMHFPFNLLWLNINCRWTTTSLSRFHLCNSSSKPLCFLFPLHTTIANLRWNQPHMIMKMHSPLMKTCKIPYNWCFLTLEKWMTTFSWLVMSFALLAIDWLTTMICPSVTFTCSLIAYCPIFIIASYLLCIGWGRGCFLTLGATLDEEPSFQDPMK